MSEFLYRPILQEVTEVTKTDGLDPYEAYAWLHEKARQTKAKKRKTYASTSITSGGHYRDESLDMMTVIQRNTESARLLAEQLASDGQIDAESTIEPVFVGKTGWSQSQYMEFWLSVIGGAELTPGFVARDVDVMRTLHHEAFERAGVNLDHMNSHTDAAMRAEEYFNMAAATADLYVSGQLDANPMSQVVRMIDTEQSLGAQAERVFARKAGIQVMNIYVTQPAGPADLASVNPELARDTARLVSFGATVFDTQQNRVRLQLVEDEAA
jgi:hypothetical protein